MLMMDRLNYIRLYLRPLLLITQLIPLAGCFIAACGYPAPKQEAIVLPRIEVSIADYVEEKITQVDTGYSLYKAVFFNGGDTTCIQTNKSGKYFKPYAFDFFITRADSVARIGALIDYLSEDETVLLPFENRTFYFENPNLNIRFDSAIYWFAYYHKFCLQDSLKEPIVAPLVPH